MSAARTAPLLRLYDGVVDPRTARVYRASRIARLSEIELALLVTLRRADGARVAREALPLGDVTLPDGRPSRSVDMLVHRVRAKIEADPSRPRHLFTVHGEGYRWQDAARTEVLRANVPTAPEPAIGRDADAEEVGRALRALGSVAVVGPGGVGKTRLAQAVADDAARGWAFAGAWWLDLADLALDAAEITARVAAVAGAEAQDADDLGRALGRRGPTLVVLDTCDRCPDAVGAVARALAGRVAVLATSRVPVPDVPQRPLPPLTGALGAALLVERARAAGVGALPADAVSRVVDAVGGLPLAIELVAARLTALPIARVAAELERDAAPRLLAARRPASPADRHASVVASVEWAWDGLADADRAALTQLAVAVGPLTPALATALVGAEGAGPLERLRAVHLLRAVDGGHAPWHAVREVALARGEPADILGATHRHAEHFAAWAEDRAEALWGPDYALSLADLDRHDADLVAAAARTDARGAARIALALADRDHERSRFARAEQRALAAVDPLPGGDPLRSPLLTLAAGAVGRLGRWPEALALAGRAVDAAADDVARAVALGWWATAAARCGRVDDAVAASAYAVDLAGSHPSARARALGAVAVAYVRGEPALHVAATEAALRAAVDARCVRLEPIAAVNRAVAAFRAGDLAGAEGALLRGLPSMAGRRRAEGIARTNLALVALGSDPARALEHAERALEAFEAIGAADGERTALGLCGALRALTGGEPREALRELDEARSRTDRVGDPGDAVLYGVALSLVGRADEARAALAAGRGALAGHLGVDADAVDGIEAMLFTGAALPAAVRASAGTPGERRWVSAQLLSAAERVLRPIP